MFATEGAVLKTCSKGKVDKLTCAAGSSMCNRRKGNSKHVSHFLDELKVLEFMWMQKRLPKLPMQQGSLWYKRYTASKSAEHAIATSYANWGCKSCCSPQWVQWYASPYGVNLRCLDMHIHILQVSWCYDAGPRSSQLWLRRLRRCGDQGVCINNWWIQCRRAHEHSKECNRPSVRHTLEFCNDCLGMSLSNT